MKKLLLILMGVALMAACNDDDYISRKNVCQFTFSYQDHPTSILFAAVTSPGLYVFVTTTGDGKSAVRHVYVTSNDSHATVEDNVISTRPENNFSYSLGASNSVGLIIGCTNFNGACAYDRSCPNCTGTRALNWTGNRQQVACGKCGRTYDLETGSVVSGDQGAALDRYYCQFDGVLLRAWN